MKQINELILYGEKLGYTVRRTNGGHYMFQGHGASICTASTGSDHRMAKIVKKNLRKIANGQTVARP